MPDAARPMRLVIITREQAADRQYGIGNSVGRIAHALEAKGHTVSYFSQADCPAVHARWQPRLRRWLRAFGPAAPALAERLVQGAWATREALRTRATHVWVHDPWMVAGVRLGLAYARRWKRPFKLVVSEHGLGAFSMAVTWDGLHLTPWQLRLLYRLEARALAKADAVICPSNTVMRWLQRDLRLTARPAHWHTLSYGRPCSPLPSREQAHTTLAPLALPNGVPVVVGIGRLAPVKRFDVLVAACALLETHYHQPVQLVIAGGGDSEALRQQGRKLGLTHLPIAQEMDAPHMAALLSVADAYASACEVEAFGLANREAIAAGLPCVVAAGGASDEVLGTGAWLVPGQPPALAQALSCLLGNPAIAHFWRQQAHSAAAQWPSWPDAADHYEQLFDAL